MEGFGFLIGLAYLAAIGIFVAYVWKLHSLLLRCAPENRALRPGLLWLQIVPVFGAIWQFFVVRALSTTLETEYLSRGWQIASRPARSLGLGKAIVDTLALIHVVAFLGVAVSLDNIAPTVGQVAFTYLFFAGGLLQVTSIVLWGAYWETVSRFSTSLL